VLLLTVVFVARSFVVADLLDQRWAKFCAVNPDAAAIPEVPYVAVQDDSPIPACSSLWQRPFAFIGQSLPPVRARIARTPAETLAHCEAVVSTFTEQRLIALRQLYHSRPYAGPNVSFAEFAVGAVTLGTVVSEDSRARRTLIPRARLLAAQADTLPLICASTDAGEAELRRIHYQAFINSRSLHFRTCCSCYRPVRQLTDSLGNIKEVTDSQKSKCLHGRFLDTHDLYERVKRLLPDVFADLQRKYALRMEEIGVDVSVKSELPMEERSRLWICTPCISFMQRSGWTLFPPRSMQNGLLLADVPPELSELSVYERHLIGRVRPFHGLVFLPLGQRAARGLSISYPSDVLTLVRSLPSSTADSDIAIVRQARDNNTVTRVLQKDALTQAQADEVVDASLTQPARDIDDPVVVSTVPLRKRKPLEFRVRPLAVRRALVWLLQHNELYKDITISTQLEEEFEERLRTRRAESEIPNADEDVDMLTVGTEEEQDSDYLTPSEAQSTIPSSQVSDPSSLGGDTFCASVASRRRAAAQTPSTDAEDLPDSERELLFDFVSATNPAPTQQVRDMRERLLTMTQQSTRVTSSGVVPIMEMQRASGKPIRINYEKAAEAMAYPSIFPTGHNHFGTNRLGSTEKLSPLQYFRSRLLAYRERCFSDPTYLFFALNAIDWYELDRAVGIAFMMRTGRERQALTSQELQREPLHAETLYTNAAGSLTKADLMQHATANREDTFVNEQCFQFMRNMRGTLAYWNKCKRDLFSMINMLGAPTWFLTFSADEVGWIECIMCAGRMTREEAEELARTDLTFDIRRRIVADNPDLVAQYFQHRFDRFFHLILTPSDAPPLGKIIDFFWRIEFQRRGSPHVHMVVWVEGAPVLEKERDKSEVVDFIAKHVSTEIPPPLQDEEDPNDPAVCARLELRNLVLRLQQHACTFTCDRRAKKGKKIKCRFCFPRPLSEVTRLVLPTDTGLPKRALYVTRRLRGDERCNAYNPHLLMAWRGNMDIQYVSSIQGVVAYVCAYMTKDEPEGFRESINRALAAMPPTATKRDKMMRMGSSILSKRELSAQEACYKLLHLPYRQSSRTIVHLDTRHSSQRTRMLRRDWATQPDGSTDLFTTNDTERYMLRPTGFDPTLGRNWDDMSLSEYASLFTVVSESSERGEETKVDTEAARNPRCFRLQPRKPGAVAQWIRLVERPRCIQTAGMTWEKDGQNYYYSLLMLHLPFRDELDLLEHKGARFSSPMHAFYERRNDFVFPKGASISNERFAAEVERVVEHLHAVRQYSDPASVLQQGILSTSDIGARGLRLVSSGDRRVFLRDEEDDLQQDGAIDFSDGQDGAFSRDAWLQEDAAHIVNRQAGDLAHAADAAAPAGRLYETETNEDRVKVSLSNCMSEDEYHALLTSLNNQQRAVFNHVEQHVRRLYKHRDTSKNLALMWEGNTAAAKFKASEQLNFNDENSMNASDSPVDSAPAPLRMFITGGGGTGKSYVLRAINEMINRYTDRRGCLVCAPTGVAAFNVSGRTLHGAFSIPVDQKQASGIRTVVEPLQFAKLQEKLALLETVDYLIIDEVSMVSDRLLSLISQRLNQLKPCRATQRHSRTFGGVSVICIGDFYQLKPVQAAYAFYHEELWRRQFDLFELQVNQRQRNDSEWTAVLNNIRVGKHIDSDFKLLQTRLALPEGGRFLPGKIHYHDDQAPEWIDALRIFPTNKLCRAYNELRTRELRDRPGGSIIHTFEAEHVVKSAPRHMQLGFNMRNVPAEWIPQTDDDCGGLSQTLKVGIGSRIMLRRNVNIAEGLVNGATGRVVGVEWAHGEDGPDAPGGLPANLLVLFDNPRVGVTLQRRALTSDTKEHGPVPIAPTNSDFSGVGQGAIVTLQRRQLPILLCWAATVHKVQGLTLERAVVCLNGLFSPAQAYVALSRVTTLQGLLISDWPTMTRQTQKIAWAHADVEKEYIRLRSDRMVPLPPVYDLQAKDPADKTKTKRRQSAPIKPSKQIKAEKPRKRPAVGKSRGSNKIHYEVEKIVSKVSGLHLPLYKMNRQYLFVVTDLFALLLLL
jgi:DNA replication protein DnaC